MFDMPYGVLDKTSAPWDTRLTGHQFVSILRQVMAIDTRENFTVVFWHNILDSQMVHNSLVELGFGDFCNFIWSKPDANLVGTNRFIHAFETATVAFHGSRQQVFFALPNNLYDRRNVITMEGVTSLSKYGGVPINVAEKPVGLMQHFFRIFCPPGSTVLVIGFGSGTDIIGCLEMDLNVVGIEMDPKQFQAASSRVQNWVSSKTSDKPQKKQDAASKQPTGDSKHSSKQPDEKSADTSTSQYPLCVSCGQITSALNGEECPVCQGWIHTGESNCHYVCPANCSPIRGVYFCCQQEHDLYWMDKPQHPIMDNFLRYIEVRFLIFYSLFSIFDVSVRFALL